MNRTAAVIALSAVLGAACLPLSGCGGGIEKMIGGPHTQNVHFENYVVEPIPVSVTVRHNRTGAAIEDARVEASGGGVTDSAHTGYSGTVRLELGDRVYSTRPADFPVAIVVQADGFRPETATRLCELEYDRTETRSAIDPDASQGDTWVRNHYTNRYYRCSVTATVYLAPNR